MTASKLPKEVECRQCKAVLVLDRQERAEGTYKCPRCGLVYRGEHPPLGALNKGTTARRETGRGTELSGNPDAWSADAQGTAPLRKTAICICISCLLAIQEIAKDIFAREDLAGTLKKRRVWQATALWVYYWLTTDLLQFSALRLPEVQTNEVLDEVAAMLVHEFGLSVEEINEVLLETKSVGDKDGVKVFLILQRLYGGIVLEDPAVAMTITLVVQSNFVLYHEYLHNMIALDEETKTSVIEDFFKNYYPPMRRFIEQASPIS